MIKDILLKDFIAHRNTKLEFCKGITIFVGHNGSGKSSIIDAITFALFGKHTRKSNKNLIRRGANSAMVQMHFTLNSREFLATRGLNGGGVQPFSQFSFVSDGDMTLNRPIVGGERKQFGESMSSEVAKVLGLDYEKLRVAAVVQQGELVRLVEAQPKEFKELLNGLIGIDRLDSAYETMRDVIVGFRDRLRDETGYTDQELTKVEEVVRKKEIELKQSESVQAEFEDERSMLHNKVRQIEQEIETMEPILLQVRELQTREEFIVRHVNERRSLISTEVSKLERIVREAASSMQLLKRKDEVDMRLQMARSEIDEVESKIGENEGASGELRGFLECAGKLQVVDGKCPVCNSPVTKVNDMFDISHVQAEIRVKAEEKSKLQVVKVELKKEEQRLAEEEKKISVAEKFLVNNSISSAGDIARLEADLNSMQQDLARLPDEIVKAGDDPFKIAIDDPSRSLAKEIILLREHVRGFKHQQYSNAKLEKTNI